MIQDNYQSILMLQNRDQYFHKIVYTIPSVFSYLVLYTKLCIFFIIEKIISDYSTPNTGKGLLPYLSILSLTSDTLKLLFYHYYSYIINIIGDTNKLNEWNSKLDQYVYDRFVLSITL